MKVEDKIFKLFVLLSTLTHWNRSLERIFTIYLSEIENYNLDDFRKELDHWIKFEKIDWVKIAIESELVHATSEFDKQNRINLDDLVIFLDTIKWIDIVHKDAMLSPIQIDFLKNVFREMDVSKYANINDLICNESLSWLPFEIKHAFRTQFSDISYTNNDIIYYLKSIIWEYLYPDFLSKSNYFSLSDYCNSMLFAYSENDGWLEMDELVLQTKNQFLSVDLFILSKLSWSDRTQSKFHFRNPYNLGFKRYAKDKFISFIK